MSKYFIVYMALMFFAASLAIADEPMHTGEGKTPAGRELAIDNTQTETTVEMDSSSALPLIQALEEAEKGLGKRRSTGEVSELTPE